MILPFVLAYTASHLTLLTGYKEFFGVLKIKVFIYLFFISLISFVLLLCAM